MRVNGDANRTQKMDTHAGSASHVQSHTCDRMRDKTCQNFKTRIKASRETFRGIKMDEAQSISQHLKREDEKQIHQAVIQTLV